MFDTIRNAWKIVDLRKKLIYTFIMLIIFRLGSTIPVPLINPEMLEQMFTGDNTMFGFIDIVSGGAFKNATIFAMSITPYINSSIIMQLLCVAIPALERLQKEGEEGRKKIGQFMRYGTVVLAIIQAVGLYFLLKSSNAITNPGWQSAIVIITTFTAGTAFLMWLGEQITEKGVGNGISLIIFAGIVSRIPDMAKTLYASVESGALNWLMVAVILVFALLIIAFVVMMNEAERRLPVQYAKRVVGRKMYGGQSTHIPIKVAGAGVIPIIFAMSIMAFPGTIASFFGKTAQSGGFWGAFLWVFSGQSWIYAVLYFLLIIFFTYFYTAIQFNPIEMSNNMKKNGGFIPGIRPGRPTSDYIARVLSRVTLAGAFFLAFIAVIPIFMNLGLHISNFSIGGTSLLIVVGVALETVQNMESQMLMRHYKGFLE
ncbi:MAG: preprotein translocase subunit SecY [Eubacteriales bacterium]|nr:preprotein translocase subunit SecY [Eubacteriales bacterium]MDY4212860.1 preprotein translocase subunit SecY [Eubacteriales bacterium]